MENVDIGIVVNEIKEKKQMSEKTVLKEKKSELYDELESMFKELGEIEGYKFHYTLNKRAGNATANDLKGKYYWIPLICELSSGKKTYVERYTINFTRQDIDTKTGNFHIIYDGETQIWHNLIEHKNNEFGGEINPIPVRLEDGSYLIRYNPSNAFPEAERGGNTNCPWGFSIDDLGIDEIPIMNVYDENYNCKIYADFIFKLIKTDLAKKIRNTNKVELGNY